MELDGLSDGREEVSQPSPILIAAPSSGSQIQPAGMFALACRVFEKLWANISKRTDFPFYKCQLLASFGKREALRALGPHIPHGDNCPEPVREGMQGVQFASVPTAPHGPPPPAHLPLSCIGLTLAGI